MHFVDSMGRRKVGYTDLFVTDASGKTLPAWLSVQGRDVTISVDDDGAAYPLTVDPILWIQQAKLVAGDGAMTDEFGNSIALSGDTALVTRSAASFHWV